MVELYIVTDKCILHVTNSTR